MTAKDMARDTIGAEGTEKVITGADIKECTGKYGQMKKT